MGTDSADAGPGRLLFTPRGWSDYRYWQAHDQGLLGRVDRLLEHIVRRPFAGPGRPLALRHLLEGCWSRRIDGEHRLVYLVDGNDVVVLQARSHYGSGS
jgi:toxin YoeB